ncbi:hypothetical protein OH76DRAFT_1011551 [Lentinus brumalis]|uniref:Uncharacterized protein n=1 Tax=Lentinus brumalis TaxID=2498619 RepID=A0A371CYB4_9APHY|nr:hypothetical protein OH76DRAFT_1011551 [Polyporus brumalis]
MLRPLAQILVDFTSSSGRRTLISLRCRHINKRVRRTCTRLYAGGGVSRMVHRTTALPCLSTIWQLGFRRATQRYECHIPRLRYLRFDVDCPSARDPMRRRTPLNLECRRDELRVKEMQPMADISDRTGQRRIFNLCTFGRSDQVRGVSSRYIPCVAREQLSQAETPRHEQERVSTQNDMCMAKRYSERTKMQKFHINATVSSPVKNHLPTTPALRLLVERRKS